MTCQGGEQPFQRLEQILDMGQKKVSLRLCLSEAGPSECVSCFWSGHWVDMKELLCVLVSHLVT